MFEQLGILDSSLQTWESAHEFGLLKPGIYVKKGEALFPRIQVKSEQPEKSAATSAKAVPVKQEPVSYTHLDVYKRQGQQMRIRIRCQERILIDAALFDTVKRRHDMNGRHFCRVAKDQVQRLSLIHI